MTKHVTRLPFIKCIVGGCGAVAAERHAICRRHLAYEVALTAAGGLAFVAAVFGLSWWVCGR